MFTFKSTKLVPKLLELRSQYSGAAVSARIVVPEDMKWWFYQEFGTATHFDSATVEVPPSVQVSDIPATTSPEGYEIHPVNAKAIRLPGFGAGPAQVVPFVGPPWTQVHPGVSPKAFIRKILSTVHAAATAQLAQGLIDGGYEIAGVRATLIDEVMPAIVDAIVESMDAEFTRISDRDTPGKLNFASPGSAFHSAASIVDSSAEGR
jgi:hypothetical protein